MSRKKRMLLFLLVVICIAGIFSGIYILLNQPNSGLRKALVTVGNTTFDTEIAKSLLARTRGLSGRETLQETSGMLFMFPTSTQSGFWMKDMKFAIDIIWIRNNKVVGVAENMMPESGKQLWSLKIYYPPESIDTALEVNAGVAKKYGVKIGDRVNVEK